MKPALTTDTQAKTEAKAEDDKSLLNKDEKKAEEKKPEEKKADAKAPEAYVAFTVPEGYELDAAAIKEAEPIFRELGLDQAGAQKLVDFYSAKAIEAANAPYKQYEEMRSGWRDEVVKDPKLGDGANLKAEVKATISRAIDSLGDPKLATDFRQAMDLTGAGDHPAFVRAFYALAQRVTEGKSVTGSGPSTLGQRAPGSGPISAAKALYPNNP